MTSLMAAQVIDVERHDCFGAYLFRIVGASEAAIDQRVTALIAVVRGVPYEMFSVLTSMSIFMHLIIYARNLSAEDDAIDTADGNTGATADEMPWWMLTNVVGSFGFFVPLFLTMNVPLARFSLTSFTSIFILYNVARWLWAFCSSHRSWLFALCEPAMRLRSRDPVQRSHECLLPACDAVSRCPEVPEGPQHH